MDFSHVLLKDICTINLGTNKPVEPPDHRSYPIIGGGMSPAGYTSNHNVDADTIIINCRGKYSGHVFRFDTPVYVNSDAVYLSNIDTNKIDKNYLYWYLKYELQSNHKCLESFQILLPTNLENQKWRASQAKILSDNYRHLPSRRLKRDYYPNHFFNSSY